MTKTIAAYRHETPTPAGPPDTECGCPEGAHDNGDPGGFYVTVQDAGRTGWLLGPYDTHREALDRVPDGRRLAEQANDRAFWYSYGTSRRLTDPRPPGLLNGRLAAGAEPAELGGGMSAGF